MYKRILALIVIVTMTVGNLPSPAYGYVNKGKDVKPSEAVTADGKRIEVEDSWDARYPYGIFLFTEGESHITEGGDEASIKLYRLGGTKGRATAYVNYNPAVMEIDKDKLSFGSAAGYGDVEIRVEDPLPVAEYQAVGKAPEPEKGKGKITKRPYTGDDKEEGDLVLEVDTGAEGWQWFVLSEDRWQEVEDATKKEFVVSREMFDRYDFRCVYVKGGKRYCTGSVKGREYEKEKEETLPEMPDDLELDPEQSFSLLEMDPENPYDGYIFEVTFADGEWVKEIKVSSPDDSRAEPMKFGTFTLVDHKGGDILNESATLTLSVEDDEEPEESTIGFTKDRFEADKAEGSAKISIKRSGGTQSLITVDYETKDGTASAGRDYQTVSGSAAFYTDLDETVIEVPLINDGIKSDEPRSFKLTLKEVKGDGRGKCTITRKETEVVLINSGKSLSGNSVSGNSVSDNSAPEASISGNSVSANLATMLYDAEAVDASGSVTVAEKIEAPSDDNVITGEAVEIPEEELIHGEIEGYDAKEGSLMTYLYPGKISFEKKDSEYYWSDEAYVAGRTENDITGWSGGSANGTGWELKKKSPGNAILKIPYMNKMYKRFRGDFEFSAELASSWNLFFDGMEYVWGSAAVTKSSGTRAEASSNPVIKKDGIEKEISYTTGGSIDNSWGVNDDVTGLGLYLKRYDADDADSNVYSRIRNGSLTRRVFNKDLALRIYTANDGDSGNGCEVSAPDGAAAMKAESGVYESLKPEITIVPGAGGVDENGKLYAGSQIRVSLKNTDSFRPYVGSMVGDPVYLSKGNNLRVKPNKPKVEKSGSDYIITMVWDPSGTEDRFDPNENYTINVVMNRVQKLELDLTPSVPRAENSSGIDTTKIGETWNDFWKNGQNRITVGYTGIFDNEYTSYLFSKKIREKYIYKSGIKGKNDSPLYDLGTLENVQYVNFNRDPGDRIVINGRMYQGNENIWLQVKDFANGKLNFMYYDRSAQSSDATMTTSVVRTELYLDGDGDGRISGEYNEETGYFVTDKTSEDTLIMLLDEDSDYNEVNFEPVKLDNGKYGEYFLKIYYSMIPRNLNPPLNGSDARAQVLPAFITSVTDQSVYSGLTEEQQSYRYILPGKDKAGNRTSDSHPMYGAEASKIQFVDVPLGGDRSPAESEEREDGGYDYSWSPSYKGNLIYPFSSPDPIYIEHSPAGDDIPLAEMSYDKDQGMHTDSKGRDNLNGYLGSFAGNTTVALCVSEQSKTADELKADPESVELLQPESSSLIRRSTVPDASYLSQMQNKGMGEADIKPSESGDAYAEMLPDLGTTLPTQVFSVMGFASLAMNKEEVLLSVSIPVFDMSSQNGGKFEKPKFIPKTITGPTTSKWDEMNSFFGSMKNEGKLPEALKQNGMQDGAKAGSLKSTQVSISAGVAFIFSWRYDNITNNYYFKEFAGGIYGGIAFKFTYRFAPCPIAYFYTSVSFDLTILSGGYIARYENERDIPYVNVDTKEKLKKGDEFGFTTKTNNINIQFNGKVFVEVLNKKGGTSVKDAASGFIKSDGGRKKSFRLTKGSGTEFGGERYVRIVALEDTTISYLNVIESISTELVWGGVTITPNLVFEVGLGVGVDFFKVEGCVKVVATGVLNFASYDDETTDRSVEFTYAKFAFMLTLRWVFFGVSTELNATGVTLSYRPERGWKKSYTVFGEETGFDSDPGAFRPVEDTVNTQHIYSPHEKGEGSLMAYDSEDPEVPFQLSGYNSSVTSFKLADGLAIGYDYQVITAGGENYVIYTYGRKDPKSAMDRPMLVLSRLVSAGGAGSQGLVSPLDEIRPKDEDSARNAIPYIPVDVDPEGKDNGTGDLEFFAWTDPDDKTIRVSWVSYKEPGAVSDNAADILREASKHTVVKTASFDTSEKNGFTAARVLSGEPGNRMMMPGVLDERVTAWIEAEPMTPAEKKSASERYEKGLIAAGFSPSDSKDPARADIGRYRLAAEEAVFDSLGKKSTISVSVSSNTVSGDLILRKLPLPEGQVADNIRFVRSGDKYFAAYTTRETRFTDAAGKAAADEGSIKNILTIRRLFLSSFPVTDDSLEWSPESVLIRTLYDYDNNDTLKDGIYSGGRITPYEDPYFANLQFLNATLGSALSGEEEAFLMNDDETEDFLLFEMNGCTYVIRQDSLSSIIDSKRGTIIPFFAVDTDLKGELNEGATVSTGRGEATIGADNEGGLAAVYIANVNNTTNNALFMSKYDPLTASWGKGVILAMNHMDVYEDSLSRGWDSRETESAYLGEMEGYSNGAYDQFIFSKPRIALKAKEEEGGNPGSGSGSQTTLLILTQGNLNPLKKVKKGEDEFLTVDNEGRGKHQAKNGIYAISYGIGHQTVGEAALSFLNEDFSAGAELHSKLSFTNTGDVSIRGSDDNEDQAVTVTLSADGEGMSDTKLISWKIRENILPGQKVELEGDFILPVTLPEGGRFNLNVSEGSYYEELGGEPYTAVLSGIKTIESKPELGFENASAGLSGLGDGALTIDGSGNPSLDIDILAGNRGNTDTDDVFIQFSYDTGETDENENPVYAPLDISDNTLTVGEEETLAALMRTQTGHDLKKGIVYLGSLGQGNGRRVRGTITLDPDKHFVGQADTLGLRAELFSASDINMKTDSSGLRTAEHGEYNPANNVFKTTIDPAVSFVLADRLILPKDALTRLPVHFVSSTGSASPFVTVQEYPDKEDTDENGNTRFSKMEQKLERLYYEERSYSSGRGEGTIVVQGSVEGSGYIRILDQNTNSYTDVPFTVASENKGMDVSEDNGRFTFYNVDGSVCSQKQQTGGQNWAFASDLKNWGEAESIAPYRGTLARGNKNAYFTFETEAESIDLYLRGEVEVSSTFPGFSSRAVGARSGNSGEESFASVKFGDNSRNIVHTVTIRVVLSEDNKKDFASIDRIVEHYSGSGGGNTQSDSRPRIYWAGSLPDRGYLSKSGIHICELHIVSDKPISNVKIQGSNDARVTFVRRANKEDYKRFADYWYYMTFRVQGGNGTLKIYVYDQNGNCTVESLYVDWFQGTQYDSSLMGEKSNDVEAGKDEDSGEELEELGGWMDARYVEGENPFIKVSVDGSAPYEDVAVVGGEARMVLDYAYSDSELDWDDLEKLSLQFGKRGQEFTIPVKDDGLYVVLSTSYDPSVITGDLDSEYAYTITRADGEETERNALEKEYFSLKFINPAGSGEDDNGNEGDDTPAEEVDTSPLHVRVNGGYTSIKVTWDDLGAKKYIVHRIDSRGKRRKKTVKRKLQFIDKKVKGDERYIYYVEAVYSKKSKKEKIRSDRLHASLLPVGQVTGVKVDTETTPGMAFISWDEKTEAKKYMVYRDDGSGKKAKKVGTVKAPGLKIRDKKFKKLKTGKYEYFVLAKIGKRTTKMSERITVSVNRAGG